jgi:hypothetical protein
LPSYHFGKIANSLRSMKAFDASRPSDLLYERESTGRLALVGVMFTAPDDATIEQLNARIPVSIGRWHRHARWCVPKDGESARWIEQAGGLPVFGPNSPIANEADCARVAGVFLGAFGPWMVHADVFRGTSLDVVWSDAHSEHAVLHRSQASTPVVSLRARTERD